MTDTLHKTPLYDVHVAFGGRMVNFAGWSLPVIFAGIIEEHIHTRTACSLFDVSHMGRLRLSGNDAATLLERLCTRNLAEAEIGRSYYTHMCGDDGGILDDMIVSRFERDWGVICNGSNREKIVAWIQQHAADVDVTLRDETLTTSMIALQGPKTVESIEDLVDEDLASIKRYRHRTFNVMGLSLTVYRCGYTGEDGFEVVTPAMAVGMFLPMLLGTKERPHAVIRPAGLGARDTLRIEAGMPLYGHELTESVDSLTAGAAWCVDLTKDFIGVEAMRDLKKDGLPRRLVGLQLDGRRIARQNHKVLCDGREVGEVTSGTLGPTLGKSIAMAYVRSDFADTGHELEVDLGRVRIRATVVALPFYKRDGNAGDSSGAKCDSATPAP